MRVAHIAWNLAGLAVPLLIAVLAVPELLAIIGRERFGLLALTWGLIGYAGVLDLGIGRALTRIVSSMLGSDDHSAIPSALATATQLTMRISLVGASFICLAVTVGATHFLKVESVAGCELVGATIMFSLALPLQAIGATYKGINEAYLNFRAVSIIRILLGAATFGLPLGVALFTSAMPALIGSLVVSRMFALIFYRREARKCIADIQTEERGVSRALRRQLLHFGGWFSVSSILNPILGSLDRVLIGAVISGAAITVYAIPQEITAQSLVIIGALTTVAFPYLTALLSKDREAAGRFFLKILFVAVCVMAVVASFVYWIGPVVLSVWLAEQMDERSGEIIEVLSFGLVPYTIGTLCISLIHSYGRADITAKVHIVGFPLYCALTFYAVDGSGLIGAAWAWVVRLAIDAILLCFAAAVVTKSWPLTRRGIVESHI